MESSSVLLAFETPLKISSFFGLFPCSFSNEKSILEAKGRLSCLLRWFITFNFLTACGIMTIGFFLSQAEDGTNTLVWYILMYMDSSKGIIDKICFVSPIFTNMYAGVMLIWELSGMGKVLALFETNLAEILPKQEISKRPILIRIMIHYTSWLCMVIAMIIMHENMAKVANVSTPLGMTVAGALLVLFFFNCSCIGVFLVIYLSTVQNLLKWVEWLLKLDNFSDFANYGLDYVKALKFFQKHVSGCLFHFCSGNVVTGIAIVYRSYSFGTALITDMENQSGMDITFGLCILIFGSIQCYLLYVVINYSQEIVDNNADLLDTIREKRLQGWIIKEDPRMEKVVDDLKEFEGFDGKGYFILNKPLLTGILANFITYIIILIQFNMTSTTSDNTPIIVPHAG